MKSYNPCRKCGSPVFADRVIDIYGNRVMSVGCWNGHYERIEIEGIKQDILDRKIKEAIPFVCFFTFQ